MNHFSVIILTSNPKHLILRAALDKEGRSESYFLDGIRNMAKLYDFDADEPYDFLSFQQDLDQLDPELDVAFKLETVSSSKVIEYFVHVIANA